MNKQAKTFMVGALALIALPAALYAAPIVDGVKDAGYGSPLSTQTTQTNFGDNNLGGIDYANGSELDEAYAMINGGTLYLMLTGNLESNFNKLEIYFDTKSGGQNPLRGDNPNVDFDGLNRQSGLTFDTGLAMDYWFACGGGGGPYQLYCNYAELLSGGGGAGGYLGASSAGSGGLSGGSNPFGLQCAIANMNTAGVGNGCGAASGSGVSSGIELAIPLAALGNPTDCIKICAFVNGGGHDYVSNQVLGSLAVGTCNLGEPHTVDFSQQPGAQWFQLCPQVTPTHTASWGSLKRLYK